MSEYKKPKITDEEARRIFQERMDSEARRVNVTPEQATESKRRLALLDKMEREGLRAEDVLLKQES